MERAPTLFRRFTDSSVYGTGSVKRWKTRHTDFIYGVKLRIVHPWLAHASDESSFLLRQVAMRLLAKLLVYEVKSEKT